MCYNVRAHLLMYVVIKFENLPATGWLAVCDIYISYVYGYGNIMQNFDYRIQTIKLDLESLMFKLVQEG